MTVDILKIEVTTHISKKFKQYPFRNTSRLYRQNGFTNYYPMENSLNEIKLGTMNMKELNSKFLSLLMYVPYIVDKKPKVQRFLSCLPYHIKDRIEYDNLKTLEEAIRKANLCYENNRKKESMSN